MFDATPFWFVSPESIDNKMTQSEWVNNNNIYILTIIGLAVVDNNSISSSYIRIMNFKLIFNS